MFSHYNKKFENAWNWNDVTATWESLAHFIAGVRLIWHVRWNSSCHDLIYLQAERAESREINIFESKVKITDLEEIEKKLLHYSEVLSAADSPQNELCVFYCNIAQ